MQHRELAKVLAPVVQTLDSAIHRINRYPVDKYTPIQPKTGSCMKARPKGYLSRESQKSWRKTPRLCMEDMECLLM